MEREREGYEEYLLECEREGVVKPRTIYEWRNRGRVILPRDMAKLIGQPVKEKKVKSNKATLARIIFAEETHQGEINRKRIIERFMDEAGLTQAGANTYYCNAINLLKKERQHG